MGFDLTPRNDGHVETAADLLRSFDVEALEESEENLDAPRSVIERCSDYADGEITEDQLHDILLREAPGDPGRVSETLSSVRDLLVYIIIVFSLSTGGDDALAQDQADPTQKVLQHKIAQDNNSVEAYIDQADVQDPDQIFGLGEDVYLVPQVVLTELSRVTMGGGGQPGGVFTADGFIEEKYVDEQDMIAYQSELIDEIGLVAADRVAELLTEENNILVTEPDESVIRHELAHRAMHSLKETVKKDLSEAARRAVEDMESSTADSTYLESLDRMYVESLSDEYLGDYSTAVKLKPEELWAYLLQDQAFNADEDAMEEVKGEKIIRYVQEDLGETEALEIIKNLTNYVDQEMNNISFS